MRNTIIEQDLQNIISRINNIASLEGKTILITGANGFLPAYIIETLLYLNEKKFNKQTRILALVRNIDKAKKRFQHYENRSDLIWINQDVSDPIITDYNIDYIIHAASQASPKYYGIDPVGTLKANVLGTYNLLELARKQNIISFLYFSSGEVYGQLKEEQIPTREDDYGYVDPMNVRSCYGESKRMGETMCVSYWHQYKIPAKIVRPFHTYGPGMELDDGRVFADFVSDIVNNRNIVMHSDGSAIRPFCYLSDATVGFFTILLNGENGSAYNIGNEHAEISIFELAKTLVNLFPEKNLEVVRVEVKNDKTYIKSPIVRNCPDTSKIKKLGWNSQVSITDGFKRTILSYL